MRSKARILVTNKKSTRLATAYDVAPHIVTANPRIEFLRLVTYRDTPNWLDLREPAERNDLSGALRAIQQDANKRTVRKVSRDEILAGNLQAIADSLCENELVGITSKVFLYGGGSGHIPMMDFICPISSANLFVLKKLLMQSGQHRGFILESGRSYHYYGMELISDEGWRTFVGKCLLMHGFVDSRYTGHQLVEGYCVLRLSTTKLKVHSPKVVAEL